MICIGNLQNKTPDSKDLFLVEGGKIRARHLVPEFVCQILWIQGVNPRTGLGEGGTLHKLGSREGTPVTSGIPWFW